MLVRHGNRIGTLAQMEGNTALVLFDDGPWFVPATSLKLYPGHDILLRQCYGQSPWSWRDGLTVQAGKLAQKRVWEKVGRPTGAGRPAASFQTLGRSENSGSLL